MVYFILLSIILLVVYIGAIYNSLIRCTNRVNEAFNEMDIYLKKRFNMIPSILSSLKKSCKYDREVIEELLVVKEDYYDEMSIDDKIDLNNKLNNEVHKLMTLTNTNPDLKDNETYNSLCDELTELEETIASYRKYYNGSIKYLNERVYMFPSNIIANIFKFTAHPKFNSLGEERESIKIEL